MKKYFKGSPMTSVGYFFAQKSCLLPHHPIKVALRLKNRKTADIQQLTSLISAFRVETEKSAIK